jgi:predicted membrane-bound spermidine synthase
MTANLELILVNRRHRKLRGLIQKSVTLPDYSGMLMQRFSWPMMLIMTFSDGIRAPVGEFSAT